MLTRLIVNGRRPLMTSGICIVLAAPLPAQASLLWDSSYTGAGFAASGTFVTADTADPAGHCQIAGITGSRDGETITGIEPAGDAILGNAGFPVDDLVTAAGLLTANGFGYETADGNFANPYYAN